MRHILALLLQNEAGALMRVAGLFSTRGYNIESLNVAPTEDPAVSRLTLVTQGSDEVIQQIAQQLLKLVDVVKVQDLTSGRHVERESLLLKLQVGTGGEDALGGAIARAGGKLLSVQDGCHVVELTSSERQIDSFVGEAREYGEILEVVRSGVLGMTRGVA